MCQPKPSLSEYTFKMNVALKMRHFPWLRFDIAGDGRYVRGHMHLVRFTQMPFFARGFHQIDLSPLDPCMWPKQYTVSLVKARDGMSTFLLRPRRTDPRDKNPLVEAFATLDSASSTRVLNLHYTQGTIRLVVTPAQIERYRLPVSANVSINMPGESLSAHATLTKYNITRQTARLRP